MNKYDSILGIFFLLGFFRLFGMMDAPTTLDQLLAYLSLHALGISVIIISQKENGLNIRLVILFFVSLIFVLTNSIAGIGRNGKTMMVVLFFMQTISLTIITKFIKLKIARNVKKKSLLTHFVISSNVVISYLYLFYPEYLYITKWWPFSGIYFIFLTPYTQMQFWAVVLIVSVSFVTATMLYKKNQSSEI